MPSTSPIVQEWKSRESCSCAFLKHDGGDGASIDEYGEEVKKILEEKGETKIIKCSRKRKKGAETYEKITRSEMKSKMKQQSESHRQKNQTKKRSSLLRNRRKARTFKENKQTQLATLHTL